MSGEKRLSGFSIVGLIAPPLFIALVLWAVRDTLRNSVVGPWQAHLAGQGPLPWRGTLLLLIVLSVSLAVPVRMLVSTIRQLRKSKEAIAAEKLRPVVPAPPAAQSPAAPYRGQAGEGDVAERYRAALSTLPFPVIKTRPGRHLKYRLASSLAERKTGDWGRLLVGGIFGLLGVVLLAASLRVGGSSLLMSLVLVVLSVVLLWPWIRPFLSGALLDPAVEVDRYLVVAGQPFRIFVQQPGPARVNRMAVKVLLSEHATYGQGTERTTDVRDVTSVWLCDEASFVIEKGSPFERSFEATIPPSSMHSFVSPNNRVEWAVRVEVDIDNWPDVKQTYPIAVLPAG